MLSTFSSQKGSKMLGMGCPDQKKKQVGLFRRVFTPHIPKISTPTSQFSVVRDLTCIGLPKRLFFTPFLTLLKSPRMQAWLFFQHKKKAVQNARCGVSGPKQQQHVGLFRRIFTPTFQKNQFPRHNSLCSSRSGISLFCLQKSTRIAVVLEKSRVPQKKP